jgi:hypothetical protein
MSTVAFNTDIHTLLKTKTPPFTNDRLERFRYSDYSGLPQNMSKNESVDLRKVIGTNHPDYSDMTWGELLPGDPKITEQMECWSRERSEAEGLMKRGMACLKDLYSNPGYYTSTGRKEHWSFSKVGDNYYITEGNHRTVLARFFLHLNGLPEVIHGVSVTEILVPPPKPKDFEPKGMFARILDLLGL